MIKRNAQTRKEFRDAWKTEVKHLWGLYPRIEDMQKFKDALEILNKCIDNRADELEIPEK